MRIIPGNAVVLLVFLLPGCAFVPPLVDDEITISEIVQRVKCEVWAAAPVPQGKYPTGPYQWMRDWTAKVDLTLETDDSGGINPGVSFINPLHPETLTGIGTFPRMFSFGVGGGLGTTATWIETLSFTLSFAELRNAAYRNACDPPQGLGLLGNLGLKEWMQAALGPVSGPRPELSQGYHAAPSSAAKAATPKPKGAAKPETFDPIQEKINKLNDTVAAVIAYADEATSYAASAQKLAKKLRSDDLTGPPEEFAQANGRLYSDGAGCNRPSQQADLGSKAGDGRVEKECGRCKGGCSAKKSRGRYC
jgi:hypothetical protein